MLAQILALMAAAAAAPPPAAAPAEAPRHTVSPLVVSPAVKPPPADLKIDMQGSDDSVDQLVVIWPGRAYDNRSNGSVRLRCLVDVHGIAERCEVASEKPEGRGFGQAALEMRPTFKLPPPMGPDGPINAVRTIALTFKAPDTQVSLSNNSTSMGKGYDVTTTGNPLKMRKVTMLDFPVWAQAANFDDLAAAYPAKGGGVEGYAVAHCHVRRTGALEACQVIKETPDGHGFGKAATMLATAKFRVEPHLAATPHRDELWVDVPMRLPPPDKAAERTVTAPVWILGFDAKTAPKVFPPEAAASGLATGRGVARCTVGPEGVLTACVPERGDPDGLGFSEAAARLAAGMKMNLWSADGAPVEGGVVHIPIRLNLKGAD